MGDRLKNLLAGNIAVKDLTESDVLYQTSQKGVDMKIAIDITSLAFKRHVNRIILAAGDGDFVPAAKLARREGIDFILAPMFNNINPSLHEHIDGLDSRCPRPKSRLSWGGGAKERTKNKRTVSTANNQLP